LLTKWDDTSIYRDRKAEKKTETKIENASSVPKLDLFAKLHSAL
jgi:hypothetical protein